MRVIIEVNGKVYKGTNQPESYKDELIEFFKNAAKNQYNHVSIGLEDGSTAIFPGELLKSCVFIVK